MLDNLVLGDEGLSLSINGAATRFDYFWLRDNARDPVSFDSRSHQRELFTAALDPDIRPDAAQLNPDASALVLDWPDLDLLPSMMQIFWKPLPGQPMACSCRRPDIGTVIRWMAMRCVFPLPR